MKNPPLSYALVCLTLVFCAGCGGDGKIARVEWPIMGTVAAVQVRGGDALSVQRARETVSRVFAEVETCLNAHAADSEIRRLASLGEAAVLARCTPRMRPCYAAAFDLARASGGAFNPRWRGTNTLDLGAIAKGFAVDLAAQAVLQEQLEGPAGVVSPDLLIDLGGNLKAVRGSWSVAVYESSTAGGSESFELAEGQAVATSGEYFRGKHIHDGRTGLPVTNGVFSVSVVHTDAQLADGLSTTLFVLGRAAGARFLTEHYPEARAIWRMR